MLTRWLTNLEPIHVARSTEELEAVYRFRYEVYAKEYGRELGVDHERKWVHDDNDTAEFTTILYSGTPDDVTGTVRLRHWDAGKVPEYDYRELSMDLLPGIDQYRVSEIGRYMIRKGMRGKLLLAAFARHSFDLLCGDKRTDLSMCYCAPGLVPYYRKIGARPFGGRPVHTPDGVMLPLVSVVSDYRYYRSVGSPLAPLVKHHFGRGKREPLPADLFAEQFESDAHAVAADPEEVWASVQDALVEGEGDGGSFVELLPPKVVKKLADGGFIFEVDAGTLMMREGYSEEEMYLVLDGLFEALDGESRLRVMGPGELFGEIAFFLPGHRRTASVRAVTDGRVLSLRGRTLRKLMDKEPAVAAEVLYRIGAVMAERTAAGSAPAADEDADTG